MTYKHNKCHSCYELCLNYAEPKYVKTLSLPPLYGKTRGPWGRAEVAATVSARSQRVAKKYGL